MAPPPQACAGVLQSAAASAVASASSSPPVGKKNVEMEEYWQDHRSKASVRSFGRFLFDKLVSIHSNILDDRNIKLPAKVGKIAFEK